MAEFVAVAKLSEVGPGQLKHIELDDGTQVCLANVDGTLYAIDGKCTHMESSTVLTQRLGDAGAQEVRRAHNDIVPQLFLPTTAPRSSIRSVTRRMPPLHASFRSSRDVTSPYSPLAFL